ncbi:MAG: aminotransferase class V-fold PLP-dependent enzyme [Bacteroidetes bacterium]|nr:aminotransferase class V-fold PLP-dependent enzyme [Bacteroidota bacterium]
MNLESYFKPFRSNTIGNEHRYVTQYGLQKMVYADWIASGRLYWPIENIITNLIGPFVGNTHTETSENGKLMTLAYRKAHQNIKKHVNAGPNDVIITTGFGMTGAVVKFQRLLGLKPFGSFSDEKCLKEIERPVVFITHMEHHSNQTSWYETVADVVVIKPGKDLLFDLNHLEDALKLYNKDRKLIGSFTACSNVTGVRTPIHEMAALMHKYGGKVFVDYAASAPYEGINMHPGDPMQDLDAVYFSPHKFLGGPGSSGVLIFNSDLYNNKVPDQPGGGTVDWTNPWGEYKFIDDIELREDGGTPGFLQAIRAALSMDLKTKMGVANIHEQEKHLLNLAFLELASVKGLHILADNVTDRLGVISFYIDSIHYNLVVSFLSDRFGIQVRGGCACAGTYGHYLLDVSYEKSQKITNSISSGDLSEKPGWVRLSLHPTMTDQEVVYIADALRQISKNHKEWSNDYTYNKHTNEFRLIREQRGGQDINAWLTLQ